MIRTALLIALLAAWAATFTMPASPAHRLRAISNPEDAPCPGCSLIPPRGSR
ncbi:MAG TPA: hypothetical protein VII75_02680 [Thermoanaerobaculia bacterium]|nr:hypothetical protein [Thermoanaerobaculia bacterium]